MAELPPLLKSHPPTRQAIQAGVVPAAFGALCGWMVGVSEIVYLVLVVPVAIGGGFLAGLEHDTARSGAIRGFVGGALFGGFIVLAHELTGQEAKAELPHPPIVLALITSVLGAGLGALGARRRAKRERGGAAAEGAEVGSKAVGGPPPGSSA